MKLIHEAFPYIVIEGMDGSGKETTAVALTHRLNNLGHAYDKVSFPQYESEAGKLIRDYLTTGMFGNDDLDKIKDDSILYTLDRFTYFANKDPQVKAGPIIFDRWTTSNVLYQSLKLSDEDKIGYAEWIENLEYMRLRLPRPSIVFALRCSPKRSTENIIKRGRDTDFFEDAEVQNKVRDNIEFFSNHLGWVIVDVDVDGEMRTVDSIVNEIMDTLSNHF